MRVFISHSSRDNLASTELANQLKDRGHEVWFDNWEIQPGHSIVAKMNEGLKNCEAGIIVFSAHAAASKWVTEECNALIYARVEDGKIVIPVVLDDHAEIPELLRPLARVRITDIDAIHEALQGRRPLSIVRTIPESGEMERVLIALCRVDGGQIEVNVKLNGRLLGEATHPRIPPPLVRAHRNFVEGTRTGVRSHATLERESGTAALAELGSELRAFCLPGDSALALQTVIANCPIGKSVEVCFEANASDLLALPFEALLLPDDRVLALQPKVVVFRRPFGPEPSESDPLAGPLNSSRHRRAG